MVLETKHIIWALAAAQAVIDIVVLYQVEVLTESLAMARLHIGNLWGVI